jgi:hypothetical protein
MKIIVNYLHVLPLIVPIPFVGIEQSGDDTLDHPGYKRSWCMRGNRSSTINTLDHPGCCEVLWIIIDGLENVGPV